MLVQQRLNLKILILLHKPTQYTTTIAPSSVLLKPQGPSFIFAS
jgi:hypothetical protein